MVAAAQAFVPNNLVRSSTLHSLPSSSKMKPHNYSMCILFHLPDPFSDFAYVVLCVNTCQNSCPQSSCASLSVNVPLSRRDARPKSTPNLQVTSLESNVTFMILRCFFRPAFTEARNHYLVRALNKSPIVQTRVLTLVSPIVWR